MGLGHLKIMYIHQSFSSKVFGHDETLHELRIYCDTSIHLLKGGLLYLPCFVDLILAWLAIDNASRLL